MNKVDRLAALLGGKGILARIVHRDASQVTRWVRADRVPPEFNQVIRHAIAARGLSAFDMAEALAMLEPDVCPTCGQIVPHGAVLG
jgi:hypothetical protein